MSANPEMSAHKHQPSSLYDSISASMEDFEARALASDIPDFPTPHQQRHLHFQSPVASEYSEATDDRGSFSPPAWRKAGSGWFAHHQGLASPMRSRETSPEVQNEGRGYSVDEGLLAAEIPLPGSPTKGRSPSPSAEPEERHASPGAEAKPGGGGGGDMMDSEEQETNRWKGSDNYIRFSVRADVQHRTEPIEATVLYLRKSYANLTKSRYSTFISIMAAMFSITFFRALLRDPVTGPTPDLIKVAGMATSFEPLMYYSENGHHQVVQLGETGVAVEDLGESIRSTNMTSGPMIVRELDELSESLKNLALDLTRFFASVDGDVDSILLVMEWAQRELTRLTLTQPTRLSSAFANLHTILSHVGLLENARTGEPTILGQLVSDIFGQTQPQATRAALQRTFHNFLAVLEEAVSEELTAAVALFAHFEAIDRQFLNLQRTAIRETDQQEREEGELLSSMWTRVIGSNQSRLRKYEKNKQLLSTIRGATLFNKRLLVDHNGRLLQLRSNLENLRKKLISPLVRSNDSSTLTVDEQIRGLEGTYATLKATRERQKGRFQQAIHETASRSGRTGIRAEEQRAVEG